VGVQAAVNNPIQPDGFLVTRTGALDQPLDVEYETGGTARGGLDYDRLPNRLTIPAGQASARIAVVPFQSRAGAGPATVTVRLVPPVRPFTFVLLPDTQYYSAQTSGATIALLEAQVQWILDRRDELNIACVLHEGDCTNNNTAAEWQRFRGAMSRLEGQVPCVIALGNHDGATGAVNNTSLFNRYFATGDYDRDPSFGGAFVAGRLDNYYRLVSAGGIDWLVFSLEFGPHNVVLDWANQVAARFPNRRIALVTHAHLSTDNTLEGSSAAHTSNPKSSGYGRENNGADVWEKFLRRQPGSALTFNGHLHGTGRLVLNNDAGKPVFQMLADYQSNPLGGGATLRIVRFFPAEDRMSVTTYSPYSDSWLRDSGNQFDYTNLGIFANTTPSYQVDPVRSQAALPLNARAAGPLSNLSARSQVGTGAQTLIVGFVTDGPKRLLLRGIGPTLAQLGVGGPLADPQLNLYGGGTVLDRNDDWGGAAAMSDAMAAVGAFGLPPASRDAALPRLLAPGAYTMLVTTTTGSSGIALAEAYDTDLAPPSARLLNVSARGQAGTGANLLIAGFVVGGPAPKTLLVRAVGPGLNDVFPQLFTASAVLANPTLAIFDGRGARIAENDNWSVSLAPFAQSAGAFALTPGSLDAALVLTLPPGDYTAQVAGVGGTTGIALVEVYDLDP
jgi:hypothetical protein